MMIVVPLHPKKRLRNRKLAKALKIERAAEQRQRFAEGYAGRLKETVSHGDLRFLIMLHRKGMDREFVKSKEGGVELEFYSHRLRLAFRVGEEDRRRSACLLVQNIYEKVFSESELGDHPDAVWFEIDEIVGRYRKLTKFRKKRQPKSKIFLATDYTQEQLRERIGNERV
jgi:hypothetical protein